MPLFIRPLSWPNRKKATAASAEGEAPTAGGEELEAGEGGAPMPLLELFECSPSSGDRVRSGRHDPRRISFKAAEEDNALLETLLSPTAAAGGFSAVEDAQAALDAYEGAAVRQRGGAEISDELDALVLRTVLAARDLAVAQGRPGLDLRFESPLIGPQGALALAELVTRACGVRSLALVASGVSALAAAEIGRGLRSNLNLVSLDLSGNALGEPGMRGLLKYLGSNRALSELRLRNADLDEECVMLLINRVFLAPTGLLRLDISDNRLHDRCLEAVARTVPLQQRLLWLDVRGNGGEAGAGCAAPPRGEANRHSRVLSQRQLALRDAAHEAHLASAPPEPAEAALPPPMPLHDSLRRIAAALERNNIVADIMAGVLDLVEQRRSKPGRGRRPHQRHAAHQDAEGGDETSHTPPARSDSSKSENRRGSNGHVRGSSDTRLVEKEERELEREPERELEREPAPRDQALRQQELAPAPAPASAPAPAPEREPAPSPPVLPMQSVPGVGIVFPSVRGDWFSFAHAESRGRRNRMEDFILLRPNFRQQREEHLFGIFDGHGGIEAARFAHAAVAEALAEQLDRSAPADDAAAEAYLKAAFARVQRQCAEYQVQNGTCALVCLLEQGRLHVASCGDSRALLVSRTGQAEWLSETITPLTPSERERIESKGGFVSDSGRVCGVLAVSRALGDIQYADIISAVPCVRSIALAPEHRWVLLACDGVWDVLQPQQVADMLRYTDCPVRATSKLRDAAFEQGSRDNISVLAIRLLPGHRVDGAA